ncbi:MAG: hypothetical protein IIA91_05535 [Chloroflexi bacterium]|nr:hypothetical protein [Chloroflexota bacterium]
MEINGNGRFLLGDFTVTHNSHMLKRVVSFAPGSRFTSGKGVSGVGLIAAVSYDKEFGQWCVEALGRIERREWLDHLENQDDVLGLAVELSVQKISLSLGVHYLDALADFADVAARGQLTKLPSQSSWGKIVDQLSVERRELLGRGALQAAINAGGNPAEPFFNLFGSEVSRSNVIDNGGAVDRFFSVVLEKRGEAGLSWLADLLDAHTNLLEEHPDKAGVSAFKERLRNAVDERPEGAVGESITRIATALGMEMPKSGKHQEEKTPE